LSRVHDMGGRPSDDPIDQSSHEWADWEHITNALVGVLRNHDLVNVDELRRGIESITPDEYEASSYYERWSASLETLLVEKGVLTSDEIDTRASEVDERWD
jgi:hypothetical protein